MEDRALVLAPAVNRDKAKTMVTQKLDGKKKITGAEVLLSFVWIREL